MTTVYLYRFYCNVESANVLYWGTSLPTLCPNVHENRDNINTSSITITKTISESAVVASDATPADGYYQITSIVLNIPAGSQGAITENTYSFPFDMYIWLSSLCTSVNAIGDIVNVIIAPDTTIGILTNNHVIGDNTLYVSSTVLTYVVKGSFINITDGVNSNNVNRVLSIDASNSTITVETPLTNNFTAMSTYVQLNAYAIRNFYIDSADARITIGEKGLRTILVRANSPIKLIYTNTTGTAKTLYWKLEYYYK